MEGETIIMTNAEKLQDIANKTRFRITVGGIGDTHMWEPETVLSYNTRSYCWMCDNDDRMRLLIEHISDKTLAGMIFTPQLQPSDDDRVMCWDEQNIIYDTGLCIVGYNDRKTWDYWAPIDKDLINKPLKDWPEDKQKGVEG